MRLNKKVKRLLRYFFIFVAAIVILYLIYIFFSSKNMYINKIVISPEEYTLRINDVVEPILKEKRFYLVPANHTAFIPRSNLIKAVETNYPEIKTVEVKHKNLQTIEIKYSLRTPLFRLSNGLAVDTDGVVYQEPKDTSMLKELILKVNLPSKEKLESISTFAKKLETTLMQVKSITIDENSDVSYIFLENNSYVITNLKDDTDILWSTLISAVTTDPLENTLNLSKKSLLYIDLRFGNKVFYKFGKSGSMSTTTNETNISTTTSLYDTRILAKPNRQ